MSSDESGLLAAVTATPWDDLPRLVYADWLEDRSRPGDAERAEFIRLHCERWRTREWKQYPQPMKARFAELRAGHDASWRASLPRLEGVEWGRYWRGFVSEALFISPAALLAHADEVFSACPVQFLQVWGLGPDDAAAVCNLPQMANLYGVRFDDVSLDLSLWRRLTACDWFANLRHLIAYPTPADGQNWDDEQRRRNDEIVRLVLSASDRGQGRLYKVFLAFPTWADHEAGSQRRVLLDGFEQPNEWEPL